MLIAAGCQHASPKIPAISSLKLFSHDILYTNIQKVPVLGIRFEIFNLG
jgi:hypothetical protein